jgi:hypothetical protein
MGGIPRTFGAFGMLSRSTFTSPNTVLRIPGSALTGATNHYQALIAAAGGDLTAVDRLRGFAVSPFEGGSALFRVNDAGMAIGSPLVTGVKVSVRKWAPPGVDKKYHQTIKETGYISEMMGGSKITGAVNAAGEYAANDFQFFVSKASGEINISGALRSGLEDVMNVDKLEASINARMTPNIHQGLRDLGVVGKSMSERYMRVLDQPLEFIEELMHGGPGGSGGLLGKGIESKPYGYLKNLLGTGGDYSGSMSDMWARHAGKLAVATIGAAAVYQAGSMITNLFADKNLAQVGGEVIGAGERVFSRLSDLTGLTALNQYQEKEAEGSGSLLGVLAFPLSGYITGHVAASVTTRASGVDDMPWRVARTEAYEVPEALRKLDDIPVVGKYFSGMKTRGAAFAAIGAAIGGALSLPFLLGSLGSSETYDEVVAKQRGETEVAVRKGAGWEMGRTDFEGEGIQYYRPGWFRRLQDDAFGDLQFGDLADKPLTRLMKGITDPYWREKEFYEDRPYAITGPDVTGMGPLGTLWGMTIGRVLKNPAYMHTEEASAGGYNGMGRGEIAQYGSDVSDVPDSALGGLGPQAVASPYGAAFSAGELAYKATEAAGLPGFAYTAIKKAITGEADIGTEAPVLASFAEMGSIRDNFWDLNIGGGYGTTEGFRRLVPNERFQLQKINNIKNTMPDWLPGPEYYRDLQHGDPYAAIPEGEYRLPGSGYASRFKELEGIDPADYPLIHQYKILADVAQHSKQFKDVSKEIKGLADSNALNDSELAIYRGTQAQLENRDGRGDFADDTGLVGSYWSALKKVGRMNPVEHLLPISPVHKFSGRLDAISEYEDKMVYSTASPDWGSPIEDFIRPALNNAARMAGFEGIPGHVQERRDLVDYFDKVEYTKYKKLENAARSEGEGGAAHAYARKAQSTMFGADPYGNTEAVMRLLPREEKQFFRDFLATSDPSQKKRIMKLVPKYTKKFYTAQWQKQVYASLAAKGDLSSEEQLAVTQIEAARALEGQGTSMGEWRDYQSAVKAGTTRENSFPDYIRAQKVGRYFEDESPLPAPPTDWLGYHPGVSSDRVKLKVVQELGKDFHDFGLWEDDVAAARREPYLDSAARELMAGNSADRDEITRSLRAANMTDLDVEVVRTGGSRTRIVFDVGANRTGELQSQLEKQGIRYGV